MIFRFLGRLIGCAVLGVGLGTDLRADTFTVYVGTYTGGNSKGIYSFELDRDTGTTSDPILVAQTPNPSFLAVHPNEQFLYAVNELGEFKEMPGGGITAFRIGENSLEQLNAKSTRGGAPCHLFVDSQGRSLLAANYAGGSVISYQLGDDGRLGDIGSFVQHEGSSVNPHRQKGPHGHGIYLTHRNDIALVTDLGLDQVLIYQFDPKTASLTPNIQPFARVQPGGGPRHLAIHPSEKFVYVLNELNSTITTFGFEASDGTMKRLHDSSTLPPAYKGSNSTAEIFVHPNGKFLYSSNRGHDSIAVFSIDMTSGELEPIGHEPTKGKTPRGFGLSPDGQWLVAANQNSHAIQVFRIDLDSGRLNNTGDSLTVPTPVCIVFAKGK